jgi:formylglycine-generating enzyme required for sulfatase activity
MSAWRHAVGILTFVVVNCAETQAQDRNLAQPLAQETERSLKPKETFRECDRCPEMVVISPGTFSMGSADNETLREKDETPQHAVVISRPFAVGKFAVTFDQWDACAADGGCGGYWPDDAGWGRATRPAIFVSWQDARAYVAWLSRKTGKQYRLLSEAEREYVTRAGTTTPFWFGTTISLRQANFDPEVASAGPNVQPRMQTVPVNLYQPNPWGLYQVHGNVWEWTEDCWNEDYRGAPSDGSAWTSGDCTRHTIRGGSWIDDVDILRATYRNWSHTNDRDDDVGFRVARSLN